MKYFFLLGTNQAISVAELQVVLQTNNFDLLKNDNVCIFESDSEVQVNELIRRLGGTIKIGIILNENIKKDDLSNYIKDYLKPTEGKFKFGISVTKKYGIDISKLAMEIKKYLKEKGQNSRWVIGKEPILSSVIVEQNKLTSKGVEISIFKDSNGFMFGKTLAVQAFKELSFRDYNRPARDDKSGMLPPKLAQIMLNLSEIKDNHILLDPFCGSGTIISEAILMGHKNIIASDASPKAVIDTKENTKWLIDNFNTKNISLSNSDLELQIIQENVKTIAKRLGANSIDRIATEPYLGPQRGTIDIKRVLKELNELYSLSLKQFDKILKNKGRIIMIWPIRLQAKKKYFLDPDLGNFHIINPLDDNLNKKFDAQISTRKTLIYGRPGQKVWREIIILEK